MRTRTKICGITRLEDAKASILAGCDALGFVFYKESPRYIALDAFKVIARELPPFVTKVGLFVNADPAEIEEAIRSGLVNVLQFHGDETPEDCQAIAAQVGRRWYKAIQVKPELDVVAEVQRFQQAGASAVLLDAWHPELKGGTGHSFDWSQFPKLDIPLILAGGLTPTNVEDAIKTTGAYAVDVSGGVESAKGIKDQQLIENFMQGVHRGSAK